MQILPLAHTRTHWIQWGHVYLQDADYKSIKIYFNYMLYISYILYNYGNVPYMGEWFIYFKGIFFIVWVHFIALYIPFCFTYMHFVTNNEIKIVNWTEPSIVPQKHPSWWVTCHILQLLSRYDFDVQTSFLRIDYVLIICSLGILVMT